MNDPCGISRCLYLLAVLANLEKNHGQAKALLEKARLIGGNEQFWHDSTFALTDAILGDDQEINDKMVSKSAVTNLSTWWPSLVCVGCVCVCIRRTCTWVPSAHTNGVVYWVEGVCTHTWSSTCLSGRLMSSHTKLEATQELARVELCAYACTCALLTQVELHVHTLAHFSYSPVLNGPWTASWQWPRGRGPLK